MNNNSESTLKDKKITKEEYFEYSGMYEPIGPIEAVGKLFKGIFEWIHDPDGEEY